MSRRQSKVERLVELSKQLWYEFIDTPGVSYTRHGSSSCDWEDIKKAAESLLQVSKDPIARKYFTGKDCYDKPMQYLFRAHMFEEFLTERGIPFKVLDRDPDTQSEFEGIAYYDVKDEIYSNDFYVMDAATYAVLAGTHKFSDFRNVSEESADGVLWDIVGMDGYLTIEKIMQLIPSLDTEYTRFIEFLRWRLERGT